MTCDPGYELVGPNVIHCNASGVWSGNFTCSLSTLTFPYIALISLPVLFFIIVILLLLLMFSLAEMLKRIHSD